MVPPQKPYGGSIVTMNFQGLAVLGDWHRIHGTCLVELRDLKVPYAGCKSYDDWLDQLVPYGCIPPTIMQGLLMLPARCLDWRSSMRWYGISVMPFPTSPLVD